MSARGIEAATWGAATRDGEVRQSKAGNDFGIVNLAISDGKTNDAGKEVSTFVKVLLFGTLANEARRISKGDRCYVEGALSASAYSHETGPRVDISIRAFRFERTGIGKQRPPRRDTELADSVFRGPGYRRDKPAIQGRDRFDFDDPLPM